MSPHTENFTPAELSFLQDLRKQTGPQHQQLESSSLSQALMKPGVEMQDYTRYLSYMYRVIEYAEEHIFPLVNDLLETSSRRKLYSIQKDLAYLHGQPVAQYFSISDKELTQAEALGYLYVIEGSTLGGRVIIKHLQKYLPVNEQDGALFFAGYGADTGKQWSSFLQTLTAYATGKHCEETVIQSAIAAFTAIREFFNKTEA